MTEVAFLKNSVRLACVRHAASVHPEPGSNSLKFVSYPPKRLQSISELVLLYLTKKLSFPGITFLRLFDANLRVPCFFRCLIFKVLVTCLFRRSRATAPTRLSSARLYYHSQPFLSTPFFNFFVLFPNFSYTYPGVSRRIYKIGADGAR